MVSSVLVDALNDPTRALKDLYDPTKPTDSFAQTVSAHFSSIFESTEAFREIPTLDVNNTPESYAPRSLVRFRAMVQDTSPSPEMYLSKLKGDKCGGWGIIEDETTIENVDYDYADLQECTVVWAVGIPGEGVWCGEEIDGVSADVTPHMPRTSYKNIQTHKFPIPGVAHVGVQVKVYDNSTTDSLKSTDLVTFVGILTSEPIHSELDHDSPTEVPTLHILFSRPLEPTIIPRTYPAEDLEVSKIRDELISWIADEGLGGDKDAAEWALLISIARVQSRNPPILPPSLTLTRFPSPASSSLPPPAPTISQILSFLLPISSTLPLSLGLLNTHNFTPESKNEDLHAGYLQLPAGCTIVITESGVSEGTVTEKGILNIKALQDVMGSQSLPYVFPFSQFSFPTDLGFIILAEGKKSAFFQTNIAIPLQQAKLDTSEPIEDLYKSFSLITLPPVEKVAQFRKLLSAAKVGKVLVGEAASEHIQNEFVRERQNDKNITADDLIMRMTIARLLALSLHEKEVTTEVWERAKALDTRRKARPA